ncbi:MAG: helix-turn-helix transcriptional regulator [Oscillospiraceae bacterium]|nr:helix-turn-helix transcriptional regulator [Oscillospiraceae bacterium]
MDQKKTGALLRALRKEHHWTQEQLAERLRVSRRSVSRWETGSNLPDLDILMELADVYAVDLRALLEGERKDGRTDRTVEEAMCGAADYTSEEKRRMTRILHALFLAAAASLAALFLLLFFEPERTGFFYSFAEGFTLSVPFAAVVAGVAVTGKSAARALDFQRRVRQRKRF